MDRFQDRTDGIYFNIAEFIEVLRSEVKVLRFAVYTFYTFVVSIHYKSWYSDLL